MSDRELVLARPPGVTTVRVTGIVVVVVSLVALVLGLFLTRSLGDDLRSTVSVSRSALEAINQTVTAIDTIASDTSASLESASGSVDSASTTVDDAVVALEQITEFLDEDLPTTIESIQMAMPAAIQTANAIDGTLSALSFFGVDYDPEEPFGDSLARVNSALITLPGEIRAQSEALRLLTPSAEELAAETGELSASMDDLIDSLEGFTALTESYETTISEAELVIDRTDVSVERSIWLIRALIIGMAVAGVAVGVGLFTTGRSIEALHGGAHLIESQESDSVETRGP